MGIGAPNATKKVQAMLGDGKAVEKKLQPLTMRQIKKSGVHRGRFGLIVVHGKVCPEQLVGYGSEGQVIFETSSLICAV